MRDNVKIEKFKEKDEVDLYMYLNIVKMVWISIENVVGYLKEEDEKCMLYDEI